MINLDMGNNLLMEPNYRGVAVPQIPQDNLEPLNYLYVIPVEIDTERALNRLDGDDKIS
jgi:hypothetical protein